MKSLKKHDRIKLFHNSLRYTSRAPVEDIKRPKTEYLGHPLKIYSRIIFVKTKKPFNLNGVFYFSYRFYEIVLIKFTLNVNSISSQSIAIVLASNNAPIIWIIIWITPIIRSSHRNQTIYFKRLKKDKSSTQNRIIIEFRIKSYYVFKENFY